MANDIFSGTTPKAGGDAYTDNPVEGIPFVRSGEITNDGLVEDESEIFLKKNIHEGLMRRSQLKNGDLLIAIVGATIGAVGIYDRDSPANINQAIAAIRLNQNRVLSEFVRWFLLTRTGQSILDFLKRPVARANINLEEIGEILIPVPSLDIQRALVTDLEAARAARKHKLAEADALIVGIDGYLLEKLGLAALQEDNRQVFAVRLKQIRNRRIDAPSYRPYFKSGIQITTPLKSLGDIADIDSNQTAPPSNDETLVPYVGLPECDLNEVREVVLRPYKEVRGRSVVKPGDILFARIEPSVFNRKYVFADDLKGHEQAYTSTEFYVVRGKEEVVEQGYLYAMFFCSFVFTQVKGKTTGSSGRRRIDPEMFASLQIPLPDMALQKTIAAEITRRRDEVRRLRAEAAKEWEEVKGRFERELLG